MNGTRRRMLLTLLAGVLFASCLVLPSVADDRLDIETMWTDPTLYGKLQLWCNPILNMLNDPNQEVSTVTIGGSGSGTITIQVPSSEQLYHAIKYLSAYASRNPARMTDSNCDTGPKVRTHLASCLVLLRHVYGNAGVSISSCYIAGLVGFMQSTGSQVQTASLSLDDKFEFILPPLRLDMFHVIQAPAIDFGDVSDPGFTLAGVVTRQTLVPEQLTLGLLLTAENADEVLTPAMQAVLSIEDVILIFEDGEIAVFPYFPDLADIDDIDISGDLGFWSGGPTYDGQFDHWPALVSPFGSALPADGAYVLTSTRPVLQAYDYVFPFVMLDRPFDVALGFLIKDAHPSTLSLSLHDQRPEVGRLELQISLWPDGKLSYRVFAHEPAPDGRVHGTWELLEQGYLPAGDVTDVFKRRHSVSIGIERHGERLGLLYEGTMFAQLAVPCYWFEALTFALSGPAEVKLTSLAVSEASQK